MKIDEKKYKITIVEYWMLEFEFVRLVSSTLEESFGQEDLFCHRSKE